MLAGHRSVTAAGPVCAGAVLATGLAAVVVFTGAGTAFAVPFVIGSLALAALLRYVVDDQHRARVARWTVAAFVAHIALGLIATETHQLRLYLSNDSFTYHDTAVALVRHWTLGFPKPFIPFGKEGFYYLLGGAYWLLGAHLAAGVVLNAVFASALVPLVTDTTKRLCGDRAAAYAAPLVVLIPGLFLWTSLLLKEAPTIFLVAVAANAGVRLSRRLTLGASLVLAVSLALLLTFRGYVAPLVAAGLIAGISASRRQLVSGISTGLTAAVLAGVLVFGAGIGSAGLQGALGSSLQDANIARKDLAQTGATGFSHDVDISTPGHALEYLPYGMLTFVLGPAPWQVHEAKQLPALVDTMVWWALLPALWRGWRRSWRRIGRAALVIVLPAVLMSAFHALLLGNIGVIVRERASVIVLVLPLIAAGLVRDPIAVEGSPRPEAAAVA